MASICLAVGPLNGQRFNKRGQVLTTYQAKNPRATQPQGVADVSVSLSSSWPILVRLVQAISLTGALRRADLHVCSPIPRNRADWFLEKVA